MAEAILEESKEAHLLLSALGLMREAIHLLDDGGAPADIGAHLDSAIIRLAKHLARLTA